jgi:hypothetical protein
MDGTSGEQHDSIYGCCLVPGENGSIILKNEYGEVLSSTVGSYSGEEAFDADGQPQGDWVVIDLARRCANMYDGSLFSMYVPTAQNLRNCFARLTFADNANGGPNSYAMVHVGYDHATMKPAFIKKPRGEQTGIISFRDDFHTATFATEPGNEKVGESINVLHAMSVTGNVTAAKCAVLPHSRQNPDGARYALGGWKC